MKSLFAILLTSAILCANAPPQEGSLSSTNASYDGQSLLLTGRVILDHGLGQMRAEEASLQRQEGGKEFPFSLIQLQKDVQLALQSNATVQCDRATLDFQTLKGVLLPVEGGVVTYLDQFKKKGEEKELAFRFSGKWVEMTFLKESKEGKSAEYEVETVLADQGVSVQYANEFQLIADHAIYRRIFSSEFNPVKKELRGTVTAYPGSTEPACRLIYLKDSIDAEKIDFDLDSSHVTLLHPVGKLVSPVSSHSAEGGMNFRADHLKWDSMKGVLLLQGNIQIEEKGLGILSAKEELTITRSTLKEKELIHSIYAKGPTTLVYYDARESKHCLNSQGSILFNQDQLHTVMNSPQEDGIVLKEQQLYYEEEGFVVYADHALVEYAIVDKVLSPHALTLKGNIRLASRENQKQVDSKLPQRRLYSLADRLTYSLTTKTLILSANPDKKVLFWDETEGVQLSAPEVQITPDPETKQPAVRGIGKVHLTLTPEEQARFHQFFP